MATINVTDVADREFIEDNEATAALMAKLSFEAQKLINKTAAFEARRDVAVTARDDFGTKVRRGLVRYKAALDGVLEAQITDLIVERDGNGDIVKLHTNAEAAAYRGSL